MGKDKSCTARPHPIQVTHITSYSLQMMVDYGLSECAFNQIRDYMIENWRDHLDPLTGEVNITGLAEHAAHFSHKVVTASDINPEIKFKTVYEHREWLDDETHPVWDLAVDIATCVEHDIQLGLF